MAWTLLIVLFVYVCAVRTQVIPGKSRTNDGEYNSVNTDGSFDFGRKTSTAGQRPPPRISTTIGPAPPASKRLPRLSPKTKPKYANHDRGQSYHLARGSARGVVGGRFGARDPATNTVKETVYTAGPRGFRAKGPNIHRKMDLDQRPRGSIGNKDDPYFDPNEDPSYAFKFDTRTYSKTEKADSRGDVKGHYSFVDDVGERHDVSYIAGRDTGFHVQSAVPDNPNLIGAPFHRVPLVRGESRPRGKTAVQRGLDGSYRFISAGPDQRRSESSDSHGNVRGSYTFLDDKGVQRTVNYIAGPGIGYRIVKNGKDPFIPAYFPTIPSIYDPDFVTAGSLRPAIAIDDASADDVFNVPGATAASGHVKPSPFDKPRPTSASSGSSENPDEGYHYNKPGTDGSSKSDGYRPTSIAGTRPNYEYNKPGLRSGSGYSSDESTFADEDVGFGLKPTKGPGFTGKPGRRPKPYPTKKPYVPLKPTQSSKDLYDDEKDNKSTPEYAIGFNIKSNPNSRTSDTNSGLSNTDSRTGGKNSRPSSIDSRTGGTDSRTGGSNSGASGTNYKPKGTTTIYNPGSTIIRNIGDEYFGVPPGVSVRAHVQSIDLYPYDSKPMSPSEAIEKDKT